MTRILRFLLKIFGRIIPTDLFARKFPVAVRGILIVDDKVILLQNERAEWDVPGGKLNRGESLRDCLKREIKEELNLQVEVRDILDSWVFRVQDNIEVVAILFDCSLQDDLNKLKMGWEHQDLRMVGAEGLRDLKMGDRLKQLILSQLGS